MRRLQPPKLRSYELFNASFSLITTSAFSRRRISTPARSSCRPIPSTTPLGITGNSRLSTNIKESESSPASVQSIFDEELKVVGNARRQNFKSYGAWHH